MKWRGLRGGKRIEGKGLRDNNLGVVVVEFPGKGTQTRKKLEGEREGNGNDHGQFAGTTGTRPTVSLKKEFAKNAHSA